MVATTPRHEFAQALPDILLNKSIIRENFFGSLWEGVKSLSNIGELFVNSTAEVRHKMAELLAGRDSHIAESRGTHELSYSEYESSVSKPSLVEYSALAAVSKFFREHNPEAKDELIVTADTINYVKIKGEWKRMEKPTSIEEAKEQVELLLNADYYHSANGTAIGVVGESGHFGASVWVMPIRLRFPSEDVKKQVQQQIFKDLEAVFEDEKTKDAKLRPGGVSSVSDLLLPYLQFGVYELEDQHERLGKHDDESKFLDSAGSKVTWLKALIDGKRTVEKPDYVLAGLGATVIGASPFGFANAVRRFIHLMSEDEGRDAKSNLVECNKIRKAVMKMIGISDREALNL